MSGEQVFEASFSPLRIILLVVLSLLFCAVGLFLMGLVGDSWRVRDTNTFSVAVGSVWVVFFGLMATRYVRLLFKDGLAVRVDAKGLLDRHISDRTIPWEHLTAFRIWEIAHGPFGTALWNQRFIQYRIEPSYERTLTGWDATLLRFLTIRNGGFRTLYHTTLDCGFEGLAQALRSIPPKGKRLK